MKFLSTFVLCLVAGLAQASYSHAPAVAVVAQPIYQKSLIAQTVKLGETHQSYPVTEHRFTRTDYETPYGATYAIPAVRNVQVTRPGYTTYINSAVTKAHVTNHQVAGPTVVQPIIKPVVQHAYAPIAHAHHGHEYGHAGLGYGHAGLGYGHAGLGYGHAGLGYGHGGLY